MLGGGSPNAPTCLSQKMHLSSMGAGLTQTFQMYSLGSQQQLMPRSPQTACLLGPQVANTAYFTQEAPASLAAKWAWSQSWSW